jgi:hypothetical protein
MRWAPLAMPLCGCAWFFQLDTFEHDAGGGDRGDDAPVDGSTSGQCSPMSMLADDFADNDLTVMWPLIAGTPAPYEQNGVAKLQMSTGDSYSSIKSFYFYDLRGDSFTVAVTDDGNFAGNDSIEVALFGTTPGYGLSVLRSGMSLHVRRIENSMTMETNVVVYDVAKHKYLRFANQGATTTLQASGDGASWSTLATYSNLPYVGFMRAVIQAYRDPGAPTYTVSIDDVNGGTPHGAACKVSQLKDTFDGVSLDLASWGRSSANGGSLTVSGGTAQLSFPANTATNVYMGATTVYDLREDSLVFQMPQTLAPAVTDAQNFFARVHATTTGDEANFRVTTDSSSQVYADRINQSGQATFPVLYSPANQWWRIRSSAGTVYWDLAATPTSWTTIATAGDLAGLDRVGIDFEIYGTAMLPAHVTLDNVGTP